MSDRLRELRIGALFALLSILFGFGLGGVFGAFESGIKGHLRDKAQGVLATVYKGDEAKAKRVVKKSWKYFKRAHLHGGGIGAGVLALILLLAALEPMAKLRKVAATLLGVGAFGYGLFWLAAGLSAPALGGTSAAKESLKLLAVPSSAALLVGLVMTIGCFALVAFERR